MIHAALASAAADVWEAPPFELTIVLSGDLAASIADREVGFTPERLGGGTVGGKTIPVQRDYSVVEMLVGAPTGDDFDQLEWIHTVLHEYGHVILGRLRAAAGTRPSYPTRDQTLPEMAAIWAFEAADEYRCELLSDHLMKGLQQAGVLSSPDPSATISLELLVQDRYCSTLTHLLDSVVHPGWPDLADSCLDGNIDIVTMFNQLVAETGHLLKMLGYADALERTAGRGRILDHFLEHLGASLYLAPAWDPIVELLESTPFIPTLSEFADVDTRLQSLGQGIVRMWETLGITGYLTAGNRLAVEVEPPLR
ncbi:hypothetical protein [Streptomyces sp. GC420]|uniref:hypothetical protein n=1 Tax=Streptomyces sp. GC420 TaxID=2697568 RepID=UPI001414EF67|nr:hypothetical protein [Streptomyces sp. GC420]NBM21004.1 hypothetical protein [Streptomyces sp. GC420]